MISFYFYFLQKGHFTCKSMEIAIIMEEAISLILKRSKHLNICIVWTVNIFVHSVKNSSQGVSSLVN